MENRVFYLYWYHLAEHTDPYSQGYVGVTCQPEVRQRCHKLGRRGGSQVLYKAFQKYGAENIQYEILASVDSAEQAYALEKTYRPSKRIGWNIAPGGGLPPDTTGRVDSPEVRMQRAESCKAFWEGKSRPSIFKGMSGRFTEEQRRVIGAAHKGKTISEAHRQAISEKNSGANSPKAKEICLVHMDNPGKVHSFPSIKIAAESLGIPYNTLRSQAQRTLKNNKSSEPSRSGWLCLTEEDAKNSVIAVQKSIEERSLRGLRIANERLERKKLKGTGVATSIN